MEGGGMVVLDTLWSPPAASLIRKIWGLPSLGATAAGGFTGTRRLLGKLRMRYHLILW
jgi:hypothetical protein